METKEVTEALEALKVKLEGSSKQEIKDALEAFEAKNKEFIKAEAKAMFDAEIKAVKDELQGKLDAVQKHADKLDVRLKERGGSLEKKTIAMEIKEKKTELKALANRTSFTDIELKATTNRASVVGNQQAVELPDIGQLATRKLSMYDAFPKFPVSGTNHNGTIRYYDWDSTTTVRAADMVAEGTVFPESTARWETVTIDLKKVGDTLPVTEEFFEDEAMFEAELRQFLITNVDLKVDDQIANGDGTGQNLTGLFTSIDAFVPVASGITDASIYDLIPKVKESITTTGGAKYAPNVVFMNIADINKYKLKKDANNNYVIPPFVSRDGDMIDGILVIESNIVVANTLALGDNRFARIYEKPGVMLSQGTVNAQFTSDMTTLKIRKRLLFLIRNADKGAWKKVTSISAALTTLATP